MVKIDILIYLKLLLNSTLQRSDHERQKLLHNFKEELHHSHIQQTVQNTKFY